MGANICTLFGSPKFVYARRHYHGNQPFRLDTKSKHNKPITSTRFPRFPKQSSHIHQFRVNVNSIMNSTKDEEETPLEMSEIVEDGNEDVNASFRSTIRSNILKRIYDKNANLSPRVLDDVLGKEGQRANGDKHQDKPIHNPLSNEWRKTLERILNYDQGHLDGQLEVSRKDALSFFVQKDWPPDEEPSKNRNRSKKSKKKPSPEKEAPSLFVIPKPKTPWRNMITDDSAKSLSSILTYHPKDSQAIEATSQNILHKDSMYERFILRSNQSLDYLHEYSYLFRRNESSIVFRFFSWLYGWFVQHSQQQPKLQNQRISSNSRNTTNQLNNNRFVLEMSTPEISLSKHYLMVEEHKLVRLLFTAYEVYHRSISTKTNQKLNRLSDLIGIVAGKIEEANSSTEAEHQMDINLLERLMGQQKELILTRRKSLIELLRVWDRVVSNKSTNRFVTSNCINLQLEEIENLDEEREKNEFERAIDLNQRMAKLISQNADFEQINASTFLSDGRLPGEPKFSSIELVYDSTKHPNGAKSQLELVYYIQILIGDKCVAQFESINLTSDFSNLQWKSKSCSITFPMIPLEQPSSQYGPLVKSAEADSPSTTEASTKSDLGYYYQQFLPKVFIYEKSTSKKGAKHNQEAKLIFQQTISDLPRLYQKSLNNSKQIEVDFDYFPKEEGNRSSSSSRVKGNLKFMLFWSSLPFNAKSAESTSSNFEFIFDQEKRQIKLMSDLIVIDQTLHDLRYLDVINWDNIGGDNEESMRRIQLIDLLLRQKYQIELDFSVTRNNKRRTESVRKAQNVVVPNVQSNLPDGDFCTDEDIEQNKRFQLMIYRNAGTNRNYRQLRFIPLSNITDVMVQQMMLTEKSEKLSIELLMDYVKTSSEEQEKRIWNLNRKRKKKRKNVDNGSAIFHDWCLSVSKSGTANRTLMSNAQHWIQTIGQVMEKLELDQQHQSQNGTDSGASSSGFFHSGRILAFSDIVREDLVETFDASDFSIFSPFVGMNRRKLNPSRKDRRKVAITLSEAVEREVQVVLSIQHAFNVPLKSDENHNLDEDEDEFDDFGQYDQCSTYVEIRYGDNQTLSSSISEGPQPTWNENFKFKLKLDPRKCITLDLFEVVKLVRSNSLTSEATTELRGSSSSKSPRHRPVDSDSPTEELNSSPPQDYKESYLHLEKRYLGQLRIPLSAILFSSKIEGTFTLASPYFLQGYRSLLTSTSQSAKKSKARLMEQQADGENVVRANPDAKLMTTVSAMQSLYTNDPEQTLLGCLPDVGLSIFLTIDPPIEPIAGIQFSQKNLSIESSELVEHCNRWRTPLSVQFPHRHFVCLVENLQNKLVLACRFLASIKPPDLTELIQLDQFVQEGGKSEKGKRFKTPSIKKLVHKEALHLNMIIRFVSLIPVYSGNPPAGNATDQLWWSRMSKSMTVWLDAVQFLSFRIGFQVEHALYLCGMLQYLDRNAYLVYGTSSLEGPTGYVILYPNTNAMPSSKEDTLLVDYEPIVINPCSGQQFSVRDFNITINSIDCIITSDNVYANIQRNSHPNSMQYNLLKSSHWQPLFTAKDYTRFAPVVEHQQEVELSSSSSSSPSSITFSIQPELINYFNSINTESVSNLESKLENHLRDQLMNWRRQHSVTFTPFNRYCTQIVRRVLPQLETHACLAATVGSPLYSQQQQVIIIEEALLAEMEEIVTVHQLVGYPLHVSPTVDFEQIASLVYSTGLHSIDAANNYRENAAMNGTNSVNSKMVEFIVSVYVHPYPANVYSIWAYVGALVPKA